MPWNETDPMDERVKFIAGGMRASHAARTIRTHLIRSFYHRVAVGRAWQRAHHEAKCGNLRMARSRTKRADAQFSAYTPNGMAGARYRQNQVVADLEMLDLRVKAGAAPASYSEGGVRVPYGRSKTRYVVLAPSGPRSNARALRAATITGVSVVFVESLSRPPAWYRNFIEAEVSVRDPLAIGELARHLHDHPEQGQLAITLNERGACFTGVLVVTFDKLFDSAELTAFADRFDRAKRRLP